MTSLVDIITSLFKYIDITLRIHWHSLIKSDKILPLVSIRSSNSFYRVRISRKKKISSRKKSFFSTFQLHKMKSIENIFAFSIICFSVYIKSIPILLALVLVVLVLLVFLVSFVSLVFLVHFVLVLVFCLRLNQLDEQRASSSYSLSHQT